MKAVRPGVAMIALCALLSACGNPSGPSKRSYEGQWTGTTAQGKTVTFTISADENVTAIIAPQVQCIPAPCPNQLMLYRAFN